MPAPPFATLTLDDLDRVPLDGAGDWRPIRRPLGITAFGVNAYTAEEAGDPLIERHDETSAGAGGHEELYLVASGRASFEVAGERLDAPAGTMVMVQPQVQREATAAEAQTTVVVIGGRSGAGLPTSPFEHWYAAIPAAEAGEFDRAYDVAAEGLGEWPEHGTLHYALGCYRALAGREEEAIEHLRVAFANDPRTREWARDDEDLAAVRERPDFPA